MMVLESGLTLITNEKGITKLVKTTTQLKIFLGERRFQSVSGTFRKRILWGGWITSTKSLTVKALFKEEKT